MLERILRENKFEEQVENIRAALNVALEPRFKTLEMGDRSEVG